MPFLRWLRAKSSATVVSVNMAVAASYPGIIAIDLIRRLKELGVQDLTHRDMVLLDYSLNEVGKYSSESTGWYDLSSGMERLIRNLYSLSVSNDSYPAIVLLETYPHSPKKTDKIDYPKSYSRLAQHYSLPIWSFRDIYWSQFSLSHPEQSRFIAELRPPDHPVWYIHLFFADVMAGIVQREFDRYFAMRANSTPAMIFTMPPPIVKLSNFNVCDENAAPLLEMVREFILVNGQHNLCYQL